MSTQFASSNHSLYMHHQLVCWKTLEATTKLVRPPLPSPSADRGSSDPPALPRSSGWTPGGTIPCPSGPESKIGETVLRDRYNHKDFWRHARKHPGASSLPMFFPIDGACWCKSMTYTSTTHRNAQTDPIIYWTWWQKMGDSPAFLAFTNQPVRIWDIHGQLNESI